MTPEEFARQLQGAPKRLAAMMVREVRRAAAHIETDAKLNASGRVLHVRSGRLRSSISATVEQGASDLLLRARAGGRGLGTGDVRYAATHEYGAVIRPVRARMLAIPLPGARTPAGVSRFASPLRQTAAGELRVTRSKDGRLWLSPARGGPPLFRLIGQVSIPRRPFLGPAVAAETPRLIQRLGDGFRVAMLGGSGA